MRHPIQHKCMPLIIMRNSYPFSLCTLLDDKNEDLGSKGLPFFTTGLRGLSNHHGKAAPEFLP
ncbi:hypothetical protein TSUD_383190 [Trifolium subterraneum]|uniref:Uncharacterized protein n=1 Tax=Trifolium subterraneum TaxID=3900 RepID=A0A2Z6MU25_TRISU|nr:hypothetical protein TSUD_383190 [Trifolium subterraneum]